MQLQKIRPDKILFNIQGIYFFLSKSLGFLLDFLGKKILR
jgi:hypothetical protein